MPEILIEQDGGSYIVKDSIGNVFGIFDNSWEANVIKDRIELSDMATRALVAGGSVAGNS